MSPSCWRLALFLRLGGISDTSIVLWGPWLANFLFWQKAAKCLVEEITLFGDVCFELLFSVEIIVGWLDQATLFSLLREDRSFLAQKAFERVYVFEIEDALRVIPILLIYDVLVHYLKLGCRMLIQQDLSLLADLHPDAPVEDRTALRLNRLASRRHYHTYLGLFLYVHLVSRIFVCRLLNRVLGLF